MSKAKFTPGPWECESEVGRSDQQRWKVTAPTPKPGRRYTVTILVNHGNNSEDAMMSEADARLIAAAPDIYEALQNMLARAVWDDEIGGDLSEEQMDPAFLREVKAARAALAKVEGRS